MKKTTKVKLFMEKEKLKNYFQEIDNQGLQGIGKSMKRGLRYLIASPYWLIIVPVFRLLVLGAFQIKYGLKRNPGMTWTLTIAPLVIVIVVLFVSLKITKTGIENQIDENSTKAIESQKAFWYKQGYEEAKKTVNANNIPDTEKKTVVEESGSKKKSESKRSRRRSESSVKKAEEKKPEETKKTEEKETKPKPVEEEDNTK